MPATPPASPGTPPTPPTPPAPTDADILNTFESKFSSIITANSTIERTASQTYNAELSKRPITNTQIQVAKTEYATTLTDAISDIEQFKTDLASQNFSNSDKSKGKIKNLNTRADSEIVKLNAKITAKGVSSKDLENDALESTPEKKIEKIKKELEKNGDGLNALYIEIAKKIKDKDGAGKLSDEEKSYYTLKLKNYKSEVTTWSIEMAALTASGAVIRQDLIDLVNDNINSLYNGSNSGDLVSKITELMDKTRDGFTSPDKKLDGVVEKMEAVSLALVTIDTEIKAKIADLATVGGLTPVQKRLFYIRALNQKSVLVKQISDFDALVQAGYNNQTQRELVSAYEVNIQGYFEAIESGLSKKKELDFEKDLKTADIKISSAGKHFEEANSLTKGFVEDKGNKLTFLQALKMRVSGKSDSEVGKEQIDRAPKKKMRRSEVRQAMNSYKKAYRDLYFAFEKIEKLYHSDEYENLKQEDRERVYQKLKEIKEEQKLINDTVGALGDALPAFSRGMLKGERFANWIGYKWNNKPEKKEKPEADWKVGLPPLIDIQLVPTATANTATPPQSTLNTATASINTPTGPAMPTIPATPVPAMTPPTP